MSRCGRMEGLKLHRIIESDNLIALEKLMPEYDGKIDVMPIDPPYNTAVSYIGYQDSGYENGWGGFYAPETGTCISPPFRDGRYVYPY